LIDDQKALTLPPKGRNPKRVLISLAVIMLLILSAFSVVSMYILLTSRPIGSTSPHDPIIINGDDGFTYDNGVVSGQGTLAEPFLIEKWDINASSANGIEIRNANVSFIISKCSIIDGKVNPGGFYPSPIPHDGIKLFKCQNGTIRDNTFINNSKGVSMQSSDGINLINNDCSDCVVGFDIYLSNKSRISYNEIDRSRYQGINLFLSSQSNISRNRVDEIVIGNGDNNTVVDNNCTYGEPGIYLVFSDNNTISRNDCPQGIRLHTSANNLINDNVCSNEGSGYGIDMIYSTNNRAFNNTCTGNVYAGIFVEYSDDNVLIGNNCSGNAFYGIDVAWANNNTISDNYCTSNAFFENDLYKGVNITQSSGIYLRSAEYNKISENIFSNNDYYGIFISNAANNSISFNLMENNSGYAIFIESGLNNTIWNNTLVFNNGVDDAYSSGHIQAFDDGGNSWNSSGASQEFGNYWSDWSIPDIDVNGFVDSPYAIAGSANAKDYYPLTARP
jgi:parallel beta-helix repeat protein